MSDVNVVTLVGRLTRDMELKYPQPDFCIGAFSLAQNRSKKQNGSWIEEPQYFDCTLMGRQAEAIAQYMTKGKQVAVSGELRQSRWQTAEGQNRSKVEIFVRNVQLLGGGQDSGQAQTPQTSANTANTANAPANQSPGFDDDVPF